MSITFVTVNNKRPPMPMNNWQRQMQQVVAMVSTQVSAELGVFKDGVEVSLSTAAKVFLEFKKRGWTVSDDIVYSKKDNSMGITFTNLGATACVKFFGTETVEA